MIRVLLVPSSDYVGHPFPQRHNQIFERLHKISDFEVHVARFKLFDEIKLNSNLIVHDLQGLRKGGIPAYYLLNALRHAIKLKRIIREENIDVVVLSNMATPFVYNLISQISRVDIPIIFDLPDYYPTSAAGYFSDVNNIAGKLVATTFDAMLGFMVRHSTLVTAASKSLVDYAKHRGAKSACQIPNGVGECFLSLNDDLSVRREIGLDKKAFVVGYIGSMEFWLDMKSLIEGIAFCVKQGLPINLLLVGGKLHTNYVEKVRSMINDEGIQEFVKFSDFVPYQKVPSVISALDVGTIPFDVSNPTAYYSAPNKLWEYLSQKVPVIATPIPEVVMNADCVFTALKPSDYMRQFTAIFNNEKRVTSKTDRGYQKALNMTWDNSTKLFASCLLSLMNGRN